MATAEHIKNRTRVLTFIITNPELHDQSEYVCGTTACIAGTALLFDLFDNNRDEVIDTLQAGRAYVDIFPKHTLIHFDSDYIWEFDTARDLLGLTEAQAAELFYELDEVQAVKKLALLAAEEPDDA